MNQIRLLVFPFIQILLFIAAFVAALKSNFILAFFLTEGAALFLCFSLHVAIHYHVHFKPKLKVLDLILDVISTVLMGIPFHYYQMSHWNHHRHNNLLGDFTSTWKLYKGTPVSRNFFLYSFFWPFISPLPVHKQIEQGYSEGYINKTKRNKMIGQTILLISFYILIFNISPVVGIAYALMVYSGWVFIAMHNYGQHLPEVYGDVKGNSYYNSIYNILSVNNGLHYEHHADPQLKYWELKDKQKGIIEHPHLIEGFSFL